jgi:hypothetical protein
VDITNPDKIKAATAQKLAIDSATISLFAAAESAGWRTRASRAISVSPMLSDGRPVAMVTVLRPDGFGVVTRKFYRIGF